MSGDDQAPARVNPPTGKRFPTVGVCASAGGVGALRMLFDGLPGAVEAAFVVVVHLDPASQSELPGILAMRTRMPVTRVLGRVRLEPGRVYVISPNRRFVITDRHLSAAAFDQPRRRRAPIDLFLRSLAAQRGDDFAVVLSGSGSDGAAGIKAVKEAAGVVLVQDPEEAEYGAMPRAAAGLADFVLPAREIAARLIELIADRGRIESHGQDRSGGAALRPVVSQPRARSGRDLGNRRKSAVPRRIGRRTPVAPPRGEARIRAVLDGVADSIVTINEAGIIQDLNAATTRMFGYTADELIGRNVNVLAAEPDKAQHDAFIRRYLRTGEARIIGTGREAEAQRRDGSTFPADLTVTEIRDGGERLFIGFIRDLSERRRLEARLSRLHANRMDSMADMATALAHELNQPLAAAANYLFTARHLIESGAGPAIAGVEEALDKASSQMHRAGQIIAHLREFMARGEPDKTEQSLHSLIRRTCELVAPSTKEAGVEIVQRLDAAEDKVLADKVQIEQAMVNIIRNAVEAMSDAPRKKLTISTAVEDGMVRADFADTGRGLPPDSQAELFVPFSTARTRGLGVGLSISRSIVEAHYGTLQADANPPEGARLRLALPLARLENAE